MQLYTYWRSLATLRVRIALNLKGIDVIPRYVDLHTGDQTSAAFRAVNPQMALPALVLDDGTTLVQSMAILEYLDEIHPAPPLLPMSPIGRARVRALAQIAVADGHPLVTPRVRAYLARELTVTEAQAVAWCHHWMGTALAAIEGHLAASRETGLFCHGDVVSLADICLASQVIGYGYFGGDAAAYPIVSRIHTRCMAIDAFASAHPLKQPGAPAAAAKA